MPRPLAKGRTCRIINAPYFHGRVSRVASRFPSRDSRGTFRGIRDRHASYDERDRRMRRTGDDAIPKRARRYRKHTHVRSHTRANRSTRRDDRSSHAGISAHPSVHARHSLFDIFGYKCARQREAIAINGTPKALAYAQLCAREREARVREASRPLPLDRRRSRDRAMSRSRASPTFRVRREEREAR